MLPYLACATVSMSLHLAEVGHANTSLTLLFFIRAGFGCIAPYVTLNFDDVDTSSEPAQRAIQVPRSYTYKCVCPAAYQHATSHLHTKLCPKH